MDYIKIVNTLNQELFDKDEKLSEEFKFTYHTDGYVDAIFINGENCIWCSENESGADTMRIRQLFNEYVDKLVKLRF